jgi:LacI family transcriptional regulator
LVKSKSKVTVAAGKRARSSAGRGTALQSERRIGLAVDAVAAYGRGVIRGIMAFSRANPRWVISVEPQWSFGKAVDIDQWDVDGLIVQTYSKEFEDAVLARALPATNVSNFCSHPLRLPTVVPNDLAVGTMAADYLLSLGFRELGYCWGGDAPYSRLRLQALRERAAAAGIVLHECNARQQDLGQWLMSLPKSIGVLGCNDDWAHRLLNAARRNGLKVPDEIAVLGVDDDELFNTMVSPSLSSIALPLEEIGYQAAALLDRIMDGEQPPEPTVLLPPVRVVARESTDVLSINDADVVQALRFIRTKAAQPLQVDDVLDHVPLSRRSLERKFRRLVGHSISAEIRRAHIDRAKQLLIETDLAMPEIATGSGFTSATRLGIVFQKEVGVSPTMFRRRSRLAGRGSTAGAALPSP